MFGKNEKASASLDPTLIKVHSYFHTIQGEGPFAGTPAVFVRLRGCNLQCFWCDTDFDTGKTYSVSEFYRELDSLLLKIVKRAGTSLVVITGGEPFLQAGIIPLSQQLIDSGYTVQVETSGSYYSKELKEFYDKNAESNKFFIVCSPKQPKIHKDLPIKDLYWKYVVREGRIDWSTGFPFDDTQKEKGEPKKIAVPPQLSKKNRIFISPCDEHDPIKNRLNRNAATRICLMFGYTLSLQLHKIVDLP